MGWNLHSEKLILSPSLPLEEQQKKIAVLCDLSPKTVENYIRKILIK